MKKAAVSWIILIALLLLCSCGTGNSVESSPAQVPASELPREEAEAPLPEEPQPGAEGETLPANELSLPALIGCWWCPEARVFLALETVADSGQSAEGYLIPGDGLCYPFEASLSGGSLLLRAQGPADSAEEGETCVLEDAALSEEVLSARVNGELCSFRRQYPLDMGQFAGTWTLEDLPGHFLFFEADGTVKTNMLFHPDEEVSFKFACYSDMLVIFSEDGAMPSDAVYLADLSIRTEGGSALLSAGELSVSRIRVEGSSLVRVPPELLGTEGEGPLPEEEAPEEALPAKELSLPALIGYWWCPENNAFLAVETLADSGQSAEAYFISDRSWVAYPGELSLSEGGILFRAASPEDSAEEPLRLFLEDAVLSEDRLSAVIDGESCVFRRQYPLDLGLVAGSWYVEEDPDYVVSHQPDGTFSSGYLDQPDDRYTGSFLCFSDVLLASVDGDAEVDAVVYQQDIRYRLRGDSLEACTGDFLISRIHLYDVADLIRMP